MQIRVFAGAIAACVVLLLSVGLLPFEASAQAAQKTILAVFAHPDDEAVVAPLLSRYAAENAQVHLVIATDGSLGVRDFAGIPAGEELAAVRAEEARCASEKLGIEAPLLLGLPDGGLADYGIIDQLKLQLQAIIHDLSPDVILTWGPDGGSGHLDHRTVSNVVTEVVQTGGSTETPRLLYSAFPRRLGQLESPLAAFGYSDVDERHLSVRVAFSEIDWQRTVDAFACHASQFTSEERAALLGALRALAEDKVYLRPWNGDGEERTGLF